MLDYAALAQIDVHFAGHGTNMRGKAYFRPPLQWRTEAMAPESPAADRLSELDDVLVVTVRKSFWASSEAERWPRRLYARVYRGHSSELVQRWSRCSCAHSSRSG